MGGGNKRSFRGGGAGGSSGDANKRAKYLPKGSVSFEAAKEERKREREGRQRQRMIGGLSKKKLTLDPFKKKKWSMLPFISARSLLLLNLLVLLY